MEADPTLKNERGKLPRTKIKPWEPKEIILAVLSMKWEPGEDLRFGISHLEHIDGDNVVAEAVRDVDHAGRAGGGEVDQAHGLVRRAPAGAGDAGDGDRHAGPGAPERALGHGPRDRLRHRAVRFDHGRRDAQHLRLRGVAVGDDSTVQHRRGSRNGGDRPGDQSSGAALGAGRGQAPGGAFLDHASRQRLDVVGEHDALSEPAASHARLAPRRVGGIIRGGHERDHHRHGARGPRRPADPDPVRRRHLHLGRAGVRGPAHGHEADPADAGRFAGGVEHGHGVLPGGLAGRLRLRPPAAADRLHQGPGRSASRPAGARRPVPAAAGQRRPGRSGSGRTSSRRTSIEAMRIGIDRSGTRRSRTTRRPSI